MIRLLLLAIFAFLIYAMVSAILRIFRGGQGLNPPPPAEKSDAGEEMVKDPECGTYLPRSDALPLTVAGRKEFFCSEACRDAWRVRFQKTGK
ncbi:hypothetical protein C2E25_00270 [Geothermobacter hydrogeniphilus]|uniref:TRASH domain-containing protein n=1 Tax=Geothermobacter hydrogeniphilus TaxID=1969733 RepID=A0A2K2HEH6_9BACT|nr:hypothetical protein [Geothermobacter hydrogeniphilus]PNU21702.1 hypothetical protein C2E25_00270 [Geothermobacter hydrogeniphilus]